MRAGGPRGTGVMIATSTPGLGRADTFPQHHTPARFFRHRVPARGHWGAGAARRWSQPPLRSSPPSPVSLVNRGWSSMWSKRRVFVAALSAGVLAVGLGPTVSPSPAGAAPFNVNHLNKIQSRLVSRELIGELGGPG